MEISTPLKIAIPISCTIFGMALGVMFTPAPKTVQKEVTKEECAAATANDYDFKPMSNDDIIAETHKCEAAGLKGESLINKERYGSLITKIQCQPKDSE